MSDIDGPSDAGPPVPPPEPDRPLAPSGRAYATLAGVVALLPVLLLAGSGVPALLAIDDRPGWLLPLVIAALAVAIVLVVGVRPVLFVRTWRYAVREDEVDIRHGAFAVVRTIVPMVRVQHVDTRRTPLADLFGVATLRLHTAAGTHEIPCLERAVADGLRTEIATRAHVPDEL